MFIACATRTMAGARAIVREDPPRNRAQVVTPRAIPSLRPILTPGDEVRRVIDLVARMHGASYREVVGRVRSERIMVARFAAISAVLQFRPKYSAGQLGYYFHRDPTSILNALYVWKTGKKKPRYGKALRKWEGRK